MNEILRYNATIQINLLVEFLYGTIQFLRILPKKNLKVCGNFCFAGELLYHGWKG